MHLGLSPLRLSNLLVSFDQCQSIKWFHDPKVHHPTLRFDHLKRENKFPVLSGPKHWLGGPSWPMIGHNARCRQQDPILDPTCICPFPPQETGSGKSSSAPARDVRGRRIRHRIPQVSSARRWRKRGHCSANLKRYAISVLSRCTII